MKRILAMCLMICLMLIIASTYAQSNLFPLLVTAGLDDATQIFTLENGVYTPLDTGDAKTYSPDYAPQGGQFVYLRWSQITLDFVAQMVAENGNFMYYGELPNDVVIYNLETGENMVIAGQPADADPESLVGAPRRSSPKWSPDGTMIAWTEIIPNADNDFINHLVIYDLTTSETRILVDLPAIFSGFPSEVQWGNNGVYVYIFNQDDPVEPAEIFLLLSANGDILFDVRIPIDFANYTATFPPFVAQDGDRELFAIYEPSGLLKLIDNTGIIEEAIGAAPRKYNRLTPDGLANIMMPSNGNAINYYVTNPTTFYQELLIAQKFTLDEALVSPDGATAIYLDWMNNVISVWHDMKVVTFNPPTNDLGEPLYISQITIGNQAIQIIRS